MKSDEKEPNYGPWQSIAVKVDCASLLNVDGSLTLPEAFRLESNEARATGEVFCVVLCRNHDENFCSMLLQRRGGEGSLEVDAQITLKNTKEECSIAQQRIAHVSPCAPPGAVDGLLWGTLQEASTIDAPLDG